MENFQQYNMATIYTSEQLKKLYGTPQATTPQVSTQDQQAATQKQGETGVKGFATGMAKGILSTVKGAGQLGAGLGQKALGSVGINVPNVYTDEATKGGLLDKQNLQANSGAEKFGKTVEQIAEFAVPATKVSNATKGASMVGKIVPRALTSGTVASLQSGEVGKDAGIATGVEVALPLAGKLIIKPATRILKSLVKGLGSGVSGVGTDTIEQIVKNPKVASSTIDDIAKGGNGAVLKKNTETIINGVSKIKQEARKAYGVGLDSLKETDIDNKVFRDSTQSILDKYGSVTKGGKRNLTNVEFSDPKNIKTANELIGKLQTAKLDGKSIRKLADDIESKLYKVATSDERLSFNAFIKDFSSSLKNGISKSTSKLDDINKTFSQDMQLAESIEKIFGKVKFKNSSEINKVSQQLETLFSKKGLSPEYIDDFLTRIGIEPEAFKTSEAVRQISNKVTGANTKGLSIGEITQQVTSSVITPKLVRDIAVLTGKTDGVIKTLLENIAPTARGALIKALLPVEK